LRRLSFIWVCSLLPNCWEISAKVFLVAATLRSRGRQPQLGVHSGHGFHESLGSRCGFKTDAIIVFTGWGVAMVAAIEPEHWFAKDRTSDGPNTIFRDPTANRSAFPAYFHKKSFQPFMP
jgi:hypothetical protein